MKRERLSPIDIFAPFATGEERKLRLRIHRARDIAQARACRSINDSARAIYWSAVEIAGRWVFARAPSDHLLDILEVLARLFLAAGAIERLEAPDE